MTKMKSVLYSYLHADIATDLNNRFSQDISLTWTDSK